MAASDISIIGLAADGGVNQNVLHWLIDDPHILGQQYLQYKKAEVWAALNSSFTGATKIGEAFSAFSHTPIGRGERWFYQVRAIDQSGQIGPFSDQVSATEISGDFNPSTFLGYWKHPNGLIEQWGQATTDASGDSTSSFTIPFPVVALNVQLTPILSSPPGLTLPLILNLVGYTKTQLIVKGYYINQGSPANINAGNTGFMYRAIGY